MWRTTLWGLQRADTQQDLQSAIAQCDVHKQQDDHVLYTALHRRRHRNRLGFPESAAAV